MAMTMTLKHLQKTPSGKWQYRRRWPTALSAVVSKAPFKMTLRGQSEAELMREYPRVDAEYHRQVKAMLTQAAAGKVESARAAWVAAMREADRMVAEVVGLDDDSDRRSVLADSLLARNADPVLIRAVMAPSLPPPAHSLWDAQEIYLREKLKGGQGSENREARVRLERVFGRVRVALGERADVSLIDMTRQDAKDIVAHMLASEKNGGGMLSPASVTILRASSRDQTVTIHHYKNDLPDGLDLGPVVAIDTETMGLDPRRDRLCVVQLSSGDGNAHLVQISRGQTAAPNLQRLLTDPQTLKLFHFGRFDIAALKNAFGVVTAPVWCTKIASRLIRTFTDRHGLKYLLQELVNVDVSKQQQTSDWGSTELSEAQKEYAASDVLYLHKLKAELEARLIREGRLDLAQRCFDFLPTRAELDLMGWDEPNDLFHH